MLSGTRRTFAIVGAHVAILYMHGLAIATGEAREACATGQPLYDVVHALQARGGWWINWTLHIDNLLVIQLLSLWVLIGLILHPQRQVLFRRFIVFHATLAVIRAVSIWVTTIPSPTDACRDRFMTASPFVRAISLTIDAIGGRHEWFGLGAGGNTCCDIIISGHAAMLVVAAVIIGMTWKAAWVRWGAWALATLGLIGSIRPDRHYTVEVLLTTLIGVLVVEVYGSRVKARGKVVGWIEEEERFGTLRRLGA